MRFNYTIFPNMFLIFEIKKFNIFHPGLEITILDFLIFYICLVISHKYTWYIITIQNTKYKRIMHVQFYHYI